MGMLSAVEYCEVLVKCAFQMRSEPFRTCCRLPKAGFVILDLRGIAAEDMRQDLLSGIAARRMLYRSDIGMTKCFDRVCDELGMSSLAAPRQPNRGYAGGVENRLREESSRQYQRDKRARI